MQACLPEPECVRVQWEAYYRLISSAYPAIDLFDDLAEPEDWLLLAVAESKTNPRLSASVGHLDLVAPQRRVGGVGASYVMAPFTHISKDRPGRFHDGSYGAFYAAQSFQTAVLEVSYHRARFYRASAEAPGWIAELRELLGSLDADLLDIRAADFAALHDPEDYQPAQLFAAKQRGLGADGLLYNSVRHAGGVCFAAFYPDVMSIPRQSRHIALHWNGECIDHIKILNAQNAVYRINN